MTGLGARGSGLGKPLLRVESRAPSPESRAPSPDLISVMRRPIQFVPRDDRGARRLSSNSFRIRRYSSAQLVSSVKPWFSTG